MFDLALDSILSHSDWLLRLNVKAGIFISFSSISYAAWIVFSHIAFGSKAEGWTSLIVSLYFTAGLIIGSIGIVGLYVGKIFTEVKNRPLYLVDEITFEAPESTAPGGRVGL